MLSRIIGKRFNCISRAVDMLCLFLGEDYTFTDECGNQIDVAEYSLHLRTQWRFRGNGTILLGSRDIYEPYSESASEDWEYDIVGRPDELSSVFDVHAKWLTLKMKDATVTDCYLSETNDITIKFSNDVVFEQFTPASGKDEEWRLIDYINNTHTICYNEDGNVSCE